MITASVAIGECDQKPINAYAIELHTPAGTFQVGVDNSGQTYISSVNETLVLIPHSSNRVRIKLED